jgi:hypothetical protein
MRMEMLVGEGRVAQTRYKSFTFIMQRKTTERCPTVQDGSAISEEAVPSPTEDEGGRTAGLPLTSRTPPTPGCGARYGGGATSNGSMVNMSESEVGDWTPAPGFTVVGEVGGRWLTARLLAVCSMATVTDRLTVEG